MNLCSTSKNHSYSATVVILLKVVTKGMKTTLLTYFWFLYVNFPAEGYFFHVSNWNLWQMGQRYSRMDQVKFVEDRLLWKTYRKDTKSCYSAVFVVNFEHILIHFFISIFISIFKIFISNFEQGISCVAVFFCWIQNFSFVIRDLAPITNIVLPL